MPESSEQFWARVESCGHDRPEGVERCAACGLALAAALACRDLLEQMVKGFKRV